MKKDKEIVQSAETNQSAEANQPTDSEPVRNNTARLRKIGQTRFGRIESQFEKSLSQCQELKRKISKLEEIIKTKKIKSEGARGETPVETPVTNFEISGFKRQLLEAKAELKFETRKLASHGSHFEKASKINAQVAKQKMRRFNESLKLDRAAKRQQSEIATEVDAVLAKLESDKDPRVAKLKEQAISDGRSFNINFGHLIKAEVKNEDVKKMLRASAVVRREIFSNTRKKYGWAKKRINPGPSQNTDGVYTIALENSEDEVKHLY